jgi:hypothetical protein
MFSKIKEWAKKHEDGISLSIMFLLFGLALQFFVNDVLAH